MRSIKVKSTLIRRGLAASALLLASAIAFGAPQQINLTAGPATATLPDGNPVPMWGYSCGAADPSSTAASCRALNPAAAGVGVWSPVVITISTGQDLQINLTNNLSFGSTPNRIPTSLVIVGQLGGGLGATATTQPSPVHAQYPNTWFIAGDTSGSTMTPPAQGPRVQSFSTEVAATGATLLPGQVASGSSLLWTGLKPGTYLIESGTHPSIQGPMGLYGMLVVTCAPSDTTNGCTPGNAFPGVSYAADVPLLFSEIDPVQNTAVDAAVKTNGFAETGTYNVLLADSVSSVGVATPGAGYTANPNVHVTAPQCTINGTTCVQATATATVDTTAGSPTVGQVTAINVTNSGAGYTSSLTPGVTVDPPSCTINKTTCVGATAAAGLLLANSNRCLLNGQPVPACYPPAVNYTPLYFLINGLAFDKTHTAASLFSTTPATGVTGSVLLRLVNAGLRMHVPSTVGSTAGASAAPGMALIAEDGNPLPGVPRVQSEVFMAAGKTYDVMINTPSACTPNPCSTPALPIYDRELSLSGNSINRDAGMLAYIGINGGGVPSTAAAATAVANLDTYNALVAGQTFTVSDPAKGVIANDVLVYGVALDATKPPAQGTVTLNTNGTFTYVPSGTATSDSFGYCANGTTQASATPICTTVTLAASSVADNAITCSNLQTFPSNVATTLAIKPPGVLAGCTDGANLPMTIAGATSTAPLTVALTAAAGTAGTGSAVLDVNGGFTANVSAAGTYTLTFQAQNSQGTVKSTATSVTLNFATPSNLTVRVLDGADKTTPITDYRWVIEEDLTFYVDPRCTTTQIPPPAGCPAAAAGGSPLVFGTNFHTSHMPLVAAGCTGPLSCESGQTLLGAPAVCDVGNGVCRTDATQQAQLDPKYVHLDPTKRYYISVLPGDAANPFIGGNLSAPLNCTQPPVNTDGSLNTDCGHGMGGAPIAAGQNTCADGTQNCVNVLTVPSPYPTAKLTVFVFEDDFPLNGEHDAGGGVDVLAPNEPGLGGFQITLFDDAGGTGDSTGQPTYDMFNQPLTNSLAGTIDPVTKLDACPISRVVTGNVLRAPPGDCSVNPNAQACQKGIVGMIVTCPNYESDGRTLSPLAGQAIVNNLYQGRYGVVATPGADRIARGEEWLQTNTLDGQKAHDSFMRIGEPPYFQEFGPAGYHVSIGFANPKIINERRTKPDGGSGMCDPAPKGGGLTCNNTVTGHVTMARMSRIPDERLYGSGTRDAFAFTQCYVSLGDPDGADFAFAKCDDQGNFTFTGIPAGNWKLTTFDQWNDQIVDGIMTAVAVGCPTSTAPGLCANPAGAVTVDMKEIAVHQWQANIYTRTFFDNNNNGVSDKNPDGSDSEQGLALVATNIRFRDGSFSNFNNTDLNGYAGFNEVFPLFNWYTIETDSTRYKTTGVHVVYDAGGAVDGSSPDGVACNSAGSPSPCGSSSIAQNFANTYEANPLPGELSLPGAVYCTDADCGGQTIANGRVPSSLTNHSTGRIDPPYWFGSYGWQGFSGQNSFLEFGKRPYADKENGGIHGHVVYASTRPFDDPQLLLQTSWEPLVPHVQVNLYREDVAADGVTPTLTLIDHTETSSFDDWAQGFRTDAQGKPVLAADGKSYLPNISCPGQSGSDPFFYALNGQPDYLNWYNSQHGAATLMPLPYNAQYKCYDGMHNWNQLQPAPYDGMYSFPSVTGLDPMTGKPSGTNCTACTTNPDSTDPYRNGQPMLPAGKYVVEVVVPPGYELVKEEDKNILIGDNFIGPVAVQFPGLGGSIFIMPDQAEIAALYNSNNPQNPTQTLGRNSTLPSHEGDTGSVETFWPCVGAMRTVPDYISLFPQSAEVAPFAGANRPLCDRKEVTLTDQSAALAKFYIFTSTHVAAHFTGVITDDFTAEFDPFSPQFGEKFAPANLPVSVKDWSGNEVNRVYADQFGAYNGLNYSTWEVDPPNPTGYGPTMMVMCMNDRGPGIDPDPLFQQGYSQFCYELPFMPAQTGYFDTPVIPTSAFSEGYNHPDCAYPDSTPAIQKVVNTDASLPPGPWVRTAVVAARAAASFTVSGVNRCQSATCGSRSTLTFPGGTVSCNNTGTGGPNCSNFSGGTRANSVASYIRSNIVTLMGAGYTASGTNASVTVTAPATGASFNGKVVVSATTNLGGPMPPVTLVGGADAAGAAMNLTVTALPDQPVDNYAYSGPSNPTAPFNQLKVNRHFGFGSTGPTTNCASGQPCVALLGSDGISYPLTVTSWSDTSITGTVTTSVTISGITHNLPVCAVQQQAVYGGSTAQCGQLVITTADGKTSIDTVTVTVGGKTPTVLSAGTSIQSAINAADPGDMIIIPPGVYNELLLMWKPVRLQGVGAASTIINADAHPAGKLLDAWRLQVTCLFGLTPDGQPRSLSDRTCSSGWTGASGGPDYPTLIVDRLPFEATLGWDATLNGNLAEQLIEPSLMGAYEGAGITVLGKGVVPPRGLQPADIFGAGAGQAAFPDGTRLVLAGDCAGGSYPTNFYCNPSSIDGLGLRNSSQGGGGIFVHAYAHFLQIANNRIYNNQGTLSGGITIGQGEHIEVPLGGAGVTNLPPGSCESSNTTNLGLPFCYDYQVNVHHNAVTLNSSLGDELFSSTPAGAGGVSINTGSDYYNFRYNWVCGNMSTGDGGGVAHIGFSKNGTIEHNSILFNQSTNPTITTNGGGLLVMGAPDADPTCSTNTDKDCIPDPSTITPSDGTGPDLQINANLILGNSADSGSGGGLRLQHVNGTDVVNFPNGGSNSVCRADLSSCRWNSANVTNNIIVNNVAGWDGGGVSLLDALAVNIVNDTIASNDSTASSGTLFSSLFAPLASAPDGGSCITNPNNASQSCPQVAGLVSVRNSAVLQANLPAGFTCPSGHGPSCQSFSVPLLYNDAIWQNRSFFIGVGDKGQGNQSQQNVVSLYNAFTNTQAPPQPQGDATTANPTGGVTITGGTGACMAASYWDIGARGDTGPTNHGSGVTLAPSYSLLTNTAGYTTVGSTNLHNTMTAPGFVSQYCNGSRSPPEAGIGGVWQVPPGTNENNALPTPVFTLAAAATVDEGNNWINMRWGPLSLTNPNVPGTDGNYGGGGPLGNYALASTSSGAYNAGTASVGSGQSVVSAPGSDFFGNPRPLAGQFDIGAVEFVGQSGPFATVSPTTLAFGNWRVNSTSGAMIVTVTNTGTVALNGGSFTLGGGPPQPFARVTNGSFPAGAPNCTGTLNVGASCSIKITFRPTAAQSYNNNSLTVAYTTPGVVITGATVTLTATGTNTPATLAITPNPQTITLPTGQITGSGTVTVTNTSAVGGTSTLISGVSISGSGVLWFFSQTAPSTDACTGAALAPGQSCTVGVEFTTILGRGVNRAGTITFTDDSTGSPQTGHLVGFATP